MNLDVAIQIISLAISLFQNLLTGTAESNAAIAQVLTKIVQVARKAYEDHVGQPLDLSVIKPEAAI